MIPTNAKMTKVGNQTEENEEESPNTGSPNAVSSYGGLCVRVYVTITKNPGVSERQIEDLLKIKRDCERLRIWRAIKDLLHEGHVYRFYDPGFRAYKWYIRDG